MLQKLTEFGKFAIELNFYVAVSMLVGFCLLSFSEDYSLFDFNDELYGVLDNNLRMLIGYLGITELGVFAFCAVAKKFQFMTLVGFFLILMVESIQFYGQVNGLAIDENFPIFFMYTGFSHLAFGILCLFENYRTRMENTRPE